MLVFMLLCVDMVVVFVVAVVVWAVIVSVGIAHGCRGCHSLCACRGGRGCCYGVVIVAG